MSKTAKLSTSTNQIPGWSQHSHPLGAGKPLPTAGFCSQCQRCHQPVPQGHCGRLCWQGGDNAISSTDTARQACAGAQTVPEAEDKRTYLVMLWGPSPHSRKKHQLQTSSPLSQPPLPLSPVKEKGERAAIKRDHRSQGTRSDLSPAR